MTTVKKRKSRKSVHADFRLFLPKGHMAFRRTWKIYALTIHSYPTAFMNGCLVVINVISLINFRKLKKGKRNYEPDNQAIADQVSADFKRLVTSAIVHMV